MKFFDQADEGKNGSSKDVENLLNFFNKGGGAGDRDHLDLGELGDVKENFDDEDLGEDPEEKRKAELEDRSWIYKTKDLRQFDPYKKFGCIEDGNQQIYGDIATSYSLNLPADYYLKMIQKELPPAEPKDPEKWFIRPHHCESLT